jgi:8-oxo-dGTP pyrophosphatase MutT (NUDIX family)
MKDDQIFYVGQKALIRKGDDILTLGFPKPLPGIDFPGGKIQEGEVDVHEALKREVREEVGLEIKIGSPFATWINIFPPHHRLAGKKVYLVAYECEYVSGEVTISNEHLDFRWVNKETYQEVDDKSPAFKVLDDYFKNINAAK